MVTLDRKTSEIQGEQTATTDYPIFGKQWTIETPDIEFMPIEPGNFNMGAPMMNLTRTTNESPVHRVKLTKPFWMSKFEIKQKIFKVQFE